MKLTPIIGAVLVYFLPQLCMAQSAGTPMFEAANSNSSGTIPALTNHAKLPKQSASATYTTWREALDVGNNRLKTKEYQVAENSFRYAVHAVFKDKSSTADDKALCLETLANVMQLQNMSELVHPIYKRSLKILRKAHGEDSITTVPALMARAVIYDNDGLYRQAEDNYRQALVAVRANSKQHDLKVAYLEYRLGLSEFKSGRPQIAQELYESSLLSMMNQQHLPEADRLENLLIDYIDLVRKTVPDRRLPSSETQAELLKDRLFSDQFDQSIEQALTSKNVSLRMLDAAENKTSSDTSGAKQQQGFSELKHRFSDAAALEQINKQRATFYERMIDIDEKSLGPNHPSVARDLTGLAYVYISQRKFDEAKEMLDRALAIYSKAYGVDPTLVKQTKLLLSFLNRRSVPETAADRQSSDMHYLSTLPSIPPEARSFEIALRLNYLALLLSGAGRGAEAGRVYAWAASATASAFGEQSELAGCCLYDYSRLLRSIGNGPEADRIEKIAQNIASRVIFENNAPSLALP